MNYNSLINQISTYANNSSTDFAAGIPNFIEMGQNRIWRDFSSLEFEESFSSGTLIVKNAFLQKPNDWNKTISFMYGTSSNFSLGVKILKQRTFEVCRIYWPNASAIDLNNPPEFYSDTYFNEKDKNGNYFFISPTPDQNYEYQLIYLKRVDPINNDNNTNLLTNNYPDLLFYACFLEALAYLRDDERIQVYEANYQRALESARAKTQDRHLDRTSNRDID